MLSTLLDASKWPNYCQIREFDMNRDTSTGIHLPKINAHTPTTPSTEHPPTNVQSKNGGASTSDFLITAEEDPNGNN